MNIKPKILLLLLSLIILYTNSFSEIKIKSLLSETLKDSIYYDVSNTRRFSSFNEKWNVFTEDNSAKKISISLPCSFEGTQSLIFEKKFFITKDEYQKNTIKICFGGIFNSIEISINKFNIIKKYGAEIPFEIELPKDVIKPDAENLVSLKVTSYYDNEITIPLKSGFLFPKFSAGILRDVFLEFIPNSYLSETNYSFSFPEKQNAVYVNADVIIKNLRLINPSIDKNDELRVEINVKPKNFSAAAQKFSFIINDRTEIKRQFSFTIQNPALWSPENPNLYIFNVSLYSGNQLIDEVNREIGIFDLKYNDNLYLNNLPFSFRGTTYYLNEAELNKISVYEKIRNDLTLIKNSGFNAVRFAKSYPNPYALKYCQQLGLIALVELPLNSVPDEILSQKEFQNRAENRLKELVKEYRRYSNTIIFGFGSSYLPNSYVTKNFINYLSESIDKKLFTYASFVGIPSNNQFNVSLLGIELYSYPPENISQIEEKIGNLSSKYFVCEVNYPNYIGSSSGYLVKNSSESQGKYFEKFIEAISKTNFSGYFINSIFNYSGNYHSFYGGSNNYYKLGLTENISKVNSLPYRVVEALQNNKQKVTIPIGISKSENKLFFIFIALGLSLIFAVLINSRKKFKEDCTRALFRPYNFFADLRDHRILSSVFTIILMFIEIGSMSLLFTILLYYFRTNILLEKILLSFGDKWLINSVSYLAWNPEECFLYLFIMFFVKILAISLIIKIASLFIKTKVDFPSIYFSVIWSFFPFVLILPVELILYKILLMNEFNIYILTFTILMMLWILQRIFKGIHVLFEVNPNKVYFYGISIIIVTAAIVILYFHFTNSTIYFIKNSIEQYSLILQ